MTTSPTQPTPPLLHNRYRIASRLGENRLAVVYRAQDERLGRQVLVHVLRPQLQDNEQLRRRFGEEAQAQARRNHPALLELFDSGEVGGRPYMITEDIEGRPLAEVLPLPLPRAVQIWRQIVGGVATTITTNTPTPPISSRTVLLTDGGRPVLTESWWLDADELRLELAHYRAPERTLGSPPDERNLVYSLGILGYELLGGIRPFSGSDAAQVQNLHVQRSLPPAMELAPGFTPSLAAALSMATARDPQARTATVQALARDLAAVESVAEAPTRQMLQPVKLRESVREAIRPITQRRMAPAPPPAMAPSAGAIPVRTPPRPQFQQRAAPYREEPPPAAVRVAPDQPAVSRDDVRQEIRREVRREARRRGCLSFIRRRVVGLVLLAALAGGCYWGVNFGLNWFTSGQAKTWACQYIPKFACDLLPVSSRARIITYVTTAETNIRSSPAISDTNVLQLVPVGTRLTSTGEIKNNEGRNWVRVSLVFENRKLDGWAAQELLQEEGTP